MEARMTINEAQSAVFEELCRANVAFPPFRSAHEGWALLREQVDGLWGAVKVKQGSPERLEAMQREAVQVAAMAIRFLTDVTE